MYNDADVVSFGTIERLTPDTARFRMFKTVKGSIVEPVIVTRGSQEQEQPGGPWEFSEYSSGPIYATLYLHQQNEQWVVMNQADPTLFSLSSLERALEKRFE
jgi:hypothetical protein